MNKKKLGMTIGSLALVGAIAVGGTLAYLTSNSGPVTNTFTVGENVEIALDESAQTAPYEVEDTTETTKRVVFNNYEDVAPGQTLYKDPQVTVVNKDADQWVFMSVKLSDDVDVMDWSDQWTKLENESNEDYVVYYMHVNEQTTDSYTGTNEGNYTKEGTQLPKLFTNVQVKDTIVNDENKKLQNIEIKAAAIQYNGFEKVQDAYDYLGEHLTFNA